MKRYRRDKSHIIDAKHAFNERRKQVEETANTEQKRKLFRDLHEKEIPAEFIRHWYGVNVSAYGRWCILSDIYPRPELSPDEQQRLQQSAGRGITLQEATAAAHAWHEHPDFHNFDKRIVRVPLDLALWFANTQNLNAFLCGWFNGDHRPSLDHHGLGEPCHCAASDLLGVILQVASFGECHAGAFEAFLAELLREKGGIHVFLCTTCFTEMKSKSEQ